MTTQVLYISYDGMTDPLGQSQVIPYLTGLTRKGYSFSLISCEKEENFKLHKEQIQSVLSSNNIDWHPISYTKKPPVLSTIYDILRVRKLAFRLQRQKQFSIVHCRSYIAALVGIQLKKKYGTKFIFDMRGLWADERVDGNLWNLSNPLYKSVYTYFKKKEEEFLECADYTISLTHNAKHEILSWKHILNNPVKIKVIPCCADLALFNNGNIRPEKKQTFMDELKILPGDLILLYLGSIGTWYLLDEMMAFFSILRQENKNAKFLFVAKDEHERILESAKKHRVEDAILIRPGKRDEIPYLISISHFSVFFIMPSYSKKASSPTKQGEIMAMGIPVICNTNVGDTDKIVLDYNSGILVHDFTASEFRNAINKMGTPFDTRQIITGAADYFSLENGVERYAAVYKDVLG